MGLETLKGDKAFYFLNEGEMFKGIILTHVDDLTMAGDETVLKKTREGIKTCMNVSKVRRIILVDTLVWIWRDNLTESQYQWMTMLIVWQKSRR